MDLAVAIRKLSEELKADPAGRAAVNRRNRDFLDPRTTLGDHTHGRRAFRANTSPIADVLHVTPDVHLAKIVSDRRPDGVAAIRGVGAVAHVLSGFDERHDADCTLIARTLHVMHVVPMLAILALMPVQDEAKAVGSSLWRIGNPGLYVNAPSSLKAAPIEGVAGSTWVGEAPDVRVEVFAGELNQIEALTKTLSERGGGSPTQVKVSGYPAARWGSGGNQALLITTSRRVWGIYAKGKEVDVARAISHATLDRVEPAFWQDRNLGTTSLQAALPYATEPILETKPDSFTQEIGFDGIRIVATEFRGSVDFDRTLELQAEDLKRQGAAAVDKVEFKAGYLINKGTRLTATLQVGQKRERATRVLASVGTRVALFSLQIDVSNPMHLAIERRILETLRVGWTTFNDFKEQTFPDEKLFFSVGATLVSSASNESLRLYGASGWLLYSLDSKGAVPNWPQEGKDLNAIVGQLVTNAGGRWQGGQDRLIGFGPFLGTLANGQGQGARGTVYTSAASMFTSQRGFLWIYMSETVSFDVMGHVADSSRFDFALPNGWARTMLGPVAMGLPEGTRRQGESSQWRAERDGVRVSVDISDLAANGDASTLIPTGGHRARTQLGRGFGWVHQGPITGGSYTLADTLILVIGPRVAKIQVAWTPTNPASGALRDAILASISTP